MKSLFQGAFSLGESFNSLILPGTMEPISLNVFSFFFVKPYVPAICTLQLAQNQLSTCSKCLFWPGVNTVENFRFFQQNDTGKV